jgi:hypothetical protein
MGCTNPIPWLPGKELVLIAPLATIRLLIELLPAPGCLGSSALQIFGFSN